MRPDAKVQVTVEYKKEGKLITPVRVHTVLISCQHIKDVSNEDLRADLIKHVI
jgi:S-adenosylmethionine synthetase